MIDAELLTKKEVAELFDLDVDSVDRLRRQGRFLEPYKPTGHRTYWIKSELLDWVRQNGNGHAREAAQ